MASTADSDQRIRFSTYWNYLAQLERFLLREYGTWGGFGRRALKDTRKLQGRCDLEPRYLRRFLRLAWNTEYLLSAGGDDLEMLRLVNHWAPVQSYYAVYCGAEAATYALDDSRSGSHRKTLRKVTEYFVNSGLAPWSFAYEGTLGKTGEDHRTPVNFPDDTRPAHNLRRAGVAPAELLARCLRAEHGHRIDDGWDSKSAAGCWKYQYDPGPTGLLHFLYRLRTKANYKGVDLFLADVAEEQVAGFNRGLRIFASWTLLYLEVIVLRRARKATIVDLGTEYLGANPDADQLERRIDFYRTEV